MFGYAAGQIENLTFMATFSWFPGTFILGFGILCLFASRQLRGMNVHRQAGDNGITKPD